MKYKRKKKTSDGNIKSSLFPNGRKYQNPDYDSLREDGVRLNKPISKKDAFEANCHIARAMKKAFCWRRWMEQFIDRDGNNLEFVNGVQR